MDDVSESPISLVLRSSPVLHHLCIAGGSFYLRGIIKCVLDTFDCWQKALHRTRQLNTS